MQSLAIKVLSVCCSASCSERNWAQREHIHTKMRNRLHRERVDKMLYVRYNLRLQIRKDKPEQNETTIDDEHQSSSSDSVCSAD